MTETGHGTVVAEPSGGRNSAGRVNWRWFALAVVIWTLAVAGISYVVYDPITCAPMDDSCMALRESNKETHLYGTVAMWLFGLVVGGGAWSVTRD